MAAPADERWPVVVEASGVDVLLAISPHSAVAELKVQVQAAPQHNPLSISVLRQITRAARWLSSGAELAEGVKVVLIRGALEVQGSSFSVGADVASISGAGAKAEGTALVTDAVNAGAVAVWACPSLDSSAMNAAGTVLVGLSGRAHSDTRCVCRNRVAHASS